MLQIQSKRRYDWGHVKTAINITRPIRKTNKFFWNISHSEK